MNTMFELLRRQVNMSNFALVKLKERRKEYDIIITIITAYCTG